MSKMTNRILISVWFATVCFGKHFLIETMNADTDSEGSDYLNIEGRDLIISHVGLDKLLHLMFIT